MKIQKKNKMLSRLGMLLIGMSVISFLVFYLLTMISNQGYRYIDTDTMQLVQRQPIPEGSPVAVIQTSAGEIRAVLYPEYAPETVKQFISLAQQGWYDNTYVFEAKNSTYFMAGSADAAGTVAAATEAQERIPRELHQNLWTFRGALCAVNTAVDTSFTKRLFQTEQMYTGSRFLFVNTVDFSDTAVLEEFQAAFDHPQLESAFLTQGGVPEFSQQIAVFGQAYAGLDVIEAICSAALTEHANVYGYTAPQEDILISEIRIATYTAEDAALNELELE